MYLQTRSWEPHLLSLAQEGRAATHSDFSHPISDRTLLEQAYAHCDALTAHHSRSFHLTSGPLPRPKREAVRALYAFCRITDDMVDRQEGNVEELLDVWRQHAFAKEPPRDDLVALAWADARWRFKIPTRYAEQLVDGVARDMFQTRYESFVDLATYCYGVASTVGLMSMHIIGFTHADAIPYAIKLGLALQLTNILRDVREDWERGRVYLPQEELTDFGLSEEDLASGRVDHRWRAFMRFQIARNRQLYQEAWPGIALLAADGRFAISAAADVYRAILEDIEAHDYNVFDRRAFITTWGKLRRLPGLWWQSRRLNVG